MPPLVPPVVAPGRMARQAQPLLRGLGVVLRPWRLGDEAAILAAYADPAVQQWHARTMTDAEARRWITSRGDGWRRELEAEWAVSRGGELVGRMGLNRVTLAEGTAEVAYWVLPGHRGGGVASAALHLMCDWAFDELGLHRIEIMHSTANLASCRVAERAGFRLEGTRRKHGLHPDGWHDMHLHGRLAGDAQPCQRPIEQLRSTVDSSSAPE